MKKILGILALLVAIFAVTALQNPDFLSPYNQQNLLRWTSLFGLLSIGAAFVIITGGIDLSIGSLVALVGSLFTSLLVKHGWSVPLALIAVLTLSAALGLVHGLLVTKVRLQPFIVTLCGLLIYRGVARWVTDDQTLGFGTGYRGLRSLAIGKPFGMAELALGVGALCSLWFWFEVRRRRGEGRERRLGARVGLGLSLASIVMALWAVLGRPPGRLGEVVSDMLVPAPFLFLLVITAAAAFLLNETVWGRHLLAVGANPEAARFSGIRTDALVIRAYMICSLLAGLGGVLFALDLNSVSPASHGNFYELYAIAAAVLGGCSLRGGEGSILGVVIGAAVMRTLYNSINLLGIPTQLEFAIIGTVILAGVLIDELVKRAVARRRAGRL